MLVIAPYAVAVPVALALADRLGADGTGLVAVALAPGALLAPAVMTAAGGRRADMAGALLLGTVILSFVLVATRPGTTTLAVTAAQAFVVASLLAGAMPALRDRGLPALRWGGHLAGLSLLAVAAGSGPHLDVTTVAIAIAATVLTLAVAGAAALALRRDLPSALAAVGTRDGVVATALAWAVGGSDDTGVPLAYTAILGIVAAALVLRRR